MTLPMWDHNGHVPERVQLPGYSDEDYAAVGQIYDQVVSLTAGSRKGGIGIMVGHIPGDQGKPLQ